MLVTTNIKPAHFAALYKSGLSECQWRILKHDYKKKKMMGSYFKVQFSSEVKTILFETWNIFTSA